MDWAVNSHITATPPSPRGQSPGRIGSLGSRDGVRTDSTGTPRPRPRCSGAEFLEVLKALKKMFGLS